MTEYTTEPIDAALREALMSLSTATLTTQLYYRGYRNTFMVGVRPLNSKAHFVAPAYTLRYIPAREDLAVPEVWKDRSYPQRKAIEAAPEGSVLVIDSRGETRVGAAGDILLQRLQKRGVAGVVVDGALRDTPILAAMDFPVYCTAAAAPPSIVALYSPDLQVPVGCGGVAVIPGDVLVGDGEGVVVIPRAIAEEVAAAAVDQEGYERFVQAKVAEGRSIFGIYPASEESRREYEKERDS
jgi:regulator of RNase E activity RraA